MDRTSYARGHVRAFGVKALLVALEKERGPRVADEWLARLKKTRADLDDETRALPLETYHVALVEFVAVAGKRALTRVPHALVSPRVLGAWLPVLRASSSPGEALTHLETLDGDDAALVRWETVARDDSSWRGRVHVSYDAQLDKDGLLRAGRAMTLAAVPLLFGLPPGEVHLGRARREEGRRIEDAIVKWGLPRLHPLGAAGLVLGGIVVGSSAVSHLPVALSLGAAGSLTIAGVVAGLAATRMRARRVDARAQRVRRGALERGLALTEARSDSRSRAEPGETEGSVVAERYRVLRTLGAGSSGIIYEGVQIDSGRPVAIKLLRAAAAHDPTSSDRLRREAEALGLAWHPNVVEAVEHGTTESGSAYLVLELLRGESLGARLRREPPLRPEEARAMAFQVCDALAAVHAAGIVHRDVKPSNIFLLPGRAGEPPRAKLIDFGLARVEWEETRITKAGAPLGTPGYMPPEQEFGGQVDARSDLYALGAVLYECFAGVPPPQAPSGVWLAGGTGARRAVPSGRERDLREALATAPDLLADVIAHALSLDPDDRYPSARDLAEALRASEEPQGEAAPAELGAKVEVE